MSDFEFILNVLCGQMVDVFFFVDEEYMMWVLLEFVECVGFKGVVKFVGYF